MSGIQFNPSTELVKQRDFLVYLRENATGNDGTYTEIGECVKDSVSIKSEDGAEVELNKSGTKILSKNCSIAFNIASLSVPNITALTALDGTTIDVCLKSLEATPMYIEAKSIIFNYNEDITSGGVNILPIVINKEVENVANFRGITTAAPDGMPT